MSKVCPCCNVLLLLDYFSLDNTRKDGRQYRCKSCDKEYRDKYKEHKRAYAKKWRESHKEYSREYYSKYHARNRESARLNKRKIYAEGRRISNEAKSEGCSACGLKDDCLAIFDFHHKNPAEKEIRVAALVGSPRKLRAEMGKCVVVCANCHRRIHDGLLSVDMEKVLI